MSPDLIPGADETLLRRAPVLKVQAALTAAGLPGRVITLTQTARSAEDAARALGCELGAIVKSLIFRAGDQAVMALVAGDRRCAVKILREELALPSAPERADADFVREKTGFSIGGVAPLGHAEPIPLLIDESLRRFEVIFAAAGHPHCVFPTGFAELQRATGGKPSGRIGV